MLFHSDITLFELDFFINFFMNIDSALHINNLYQPAIQCTISNKIVNSIYSIYFFKRHYDSKSNTFTIFQIQPIVGFYFHSPIFVLIGFFRTSFFCYALGNIFYIIPFSKLFPCFTFQKIVFFIT